MTHTTRSLPKCIIIAGPTAGGKTSLSVKLAQVLDGEVVNADSMQVYRGMDIGTAKPDASEQKGIPHHLLDVVDPDEEFNVAMFRDMALPVVRDIISRKKVCLITGGTGLYIKGLTHGLFDCPPNDLEFRESLSRDLETQGIGSLYERLKQIDPVAAEKIHPNDRVRIMRALEIHHLTLCRASDMAAAHNFKEISLNPLKIFLEVDREKLYDRINGRCLEMVAKGLVEETRGLLQAGYSPDLKSMGAIGYRHMVGYLQGRWSLEEAVSHMQRDTRHYAKRQLTWFRADPEYMRYSPDDVEGVTRCIQSFLAET